MKKTNDGTLYLGIDDIMDEIENLARSQGFYGRLYNFMVDLRDNHSDLWQVYVDELEAQHFRTTLDMVLYFEQ